MKHFYNNKKNTFNTNLLHKHFSICFTWNTFSPFRLQPDCFMWTTNTISFFEKSFFVSCETFISKRIFTTKEPCLVSHETLHLDNELLFHMKQFQKVLFLIHSYANLIDPISFLFFRSNNVSCETSIQTALKTIESRNFPKESQMFFHISLLSVKTVSRETNF